MKRRELLKSMGFLGAAYWLDPEWLRAHAAFNAMPPHTKGVKLPSRLSFLAHQATGQEGHWLLNDVDGRIPEDLSGTLYRVAPGQKETFGQPLNHFFDGDAFLSAFQFQSGQVILKSKFIDTPEREEEQRSQKMLYRDFGTYPSGRAKGNKSAPNVNLLVLKDEILALSESRQAFSIDSKNWKTLGLKNFNGTWPKNVSFTAHPKRDPRTGKIYAYGTKQGLGLDLMVYEIDPHSDQARLIYKQGQDRAYVIHDMLLTEKYVILFVPPFFMNWKDLIFSGKTMGDSLRFDEKSVCQILVIPKGGSEKVTRFELPSCMVFHHGNAYESGSEIILDTFIAKDNSGFDAMASWRAETLPEVHHPVLTRLRLDLNSKKIIENTPLVAGCDFPAVDLNLLGQQQDMLFMAGFNRQDDMLAPSEIVSFDFSKDQERRYEVAVDEICGEPVVHGRWLFVLGYQRSRNESFLDILDQKSLQLISRVWFGRVLPLGFHGCFIA